MGKLPTAPFEVRLAATSFLLLLGLANLFGAWQVANFAAFTPRGVARTVAPRATSPPVEEPAVRPRETPIDLAALDEPEHHIHRQLLVQDSHVHVPVYAMTAALLALVVFGLRLSSRARSALVLTAFVAPLLDFAGLWGAHLLPALGSAFGGLAVAGGFAMGAVYLVVLVLTLKQCWFEPERSTS